MRPTTHGEDGSLSGTAPGGTHGGAVILPGDTNEEEPGRAYQQAEQGPR